MTELAAISRLHAPNCARRCRTSRWQPLQIVGDVQDGDALLRRVLDREDYLEWHADEQRWVPSLAGLRFDLDGMSTFVEEFLNSRGDAASDVATLGGLSQEELVYSVVALALRDAGMRVAASPNDETTIGYAHASVFPPPGLSKPDARRAIGHVLAHAMRPRAALAVTPHLRRRGELGTSCGSRGDGGQLGPGLPRLTVTSRLFCRSIAIPRLPQVYDS